MPPQYIKIISKDGFTFIVPREAAMVAGTWKQMLSSENYLESQTGEIYSQETSDLLSVIVDYLFYNLNFRKHEGQINEFVFPTEMSLQLLVAADYLNV